MTTTTKPQRPRRLHDPHVRALWKLGAFQEYLRRQRDYWARVDARAKREAEAQRTLGNHRTLPGDMQDPDSPPPRRYPIEEADREERAVGRKLRHAYRGIVGDSPQLGPGDHTGAFAMLAGVQRAIEHGMWTRNEWTALHEMERKWRARAEGRDARFEVAGTKPGRLKRPEEQQMRIARDRARQVERVRRG